MNKTKIFVYLPRYPKYSGLFNEVSNEMFNKFTLKIILILVLIILIGWLFFNIVIYFVVSIIIATILRPLTERISEIQIFRLRFPRGLAVLISFLAFPSLIGLFVLLFVPLVSEEIQIITNINYDMLIETILIPIETIEDYLTIYGIIESEHRFLDSIHKSIISWGSSQDYRKILNFIFSITGNLLVTILAVSFITFFLTYKRGLLSKLLLAIIPNQYFELTIGALNKIDKLLTNYLLGLFLQMFAVFSIAALGLTIVGVKYAITIAVFAAIVNLIPYIGPILGALFGIIVGLSTLSFTNFGNEYWVVIVKIISVFVVLQITDNIVFQPVIFSKSVKAHPLEIFVIIFAGASLAGPAGMIAAIPVYTILRVSVIELWKGYQSYSIFQKS